MKSPVRTSLPRLAAMLSIAATVSWLLGGTAAAASASPQLPAAGDGFAVSLAAATSYAHVGEAVTLTATTNTDVGPTPYYITIYSQTTGAELAVCGFGTTCTATVTQARSGSQAFEAFVGDDVPGSGHPGFALVSGNEVQVSWFFILRFATSPAPW